MRYVGVHGVIYGLHDPLTGALRYVGQTTKVVEERLAAHLTPGALKRHSYLSRWLGGLVKVGLRPRVSIRAGARDQTELDRLEIEHIAAERKNGTRLVNLSNGGGGRFGYVPTAAEREKIRRAQLGVPKPPHTEEWKRYMSALMKGRPSANSEGHHKKLAAAKRGVPRSEETKTKISAAKAGVKQSDAHRKAISAALKGRPHPWAKPGPDAPHYRHDVSTAEICQRLSAPNATKAQVARDMGISRTFIYRRLASEAS